MKRTISRPVCIKHNSSSLQLIEVFYGSVQTANGALPPPTASEFEVLLQYEASSS